jgi:hypothetical protein
MAIVAGAATIFAGLELCRPPLVRAEVGAPWYSGHYADAVVAGTTVDGRSVAVVGGTHVDFPYDDPRSTWAQLGLFVAGETPVVITGRPGLANLDLALNSGFTRLSYRSPRLRVGLKLKSVQHRPRYEGDPFDLGDFLIGHGVESDFHPGLVYTPYELTKLVRGRIVRRSGSNESRGEEIRFERLHGQGETGTVQAPTDRSFQTAYDYLAAPTRSGRPYTYVGFHTYALHGGAQGAPSRYFESTASDEFTLEDGRLIEGNPHAVPPPYDNTSGAPAGARNLAHWRVDLGPGILHRALVRLPDGNKRGLVALSETIKEDNGG